VERFAGLCHIDEWGFPIERSRIEVCEIHHLGKIIGHNETVTIDATIKTETKEINVKPGDTVKTVVKHSEIRRANDHFIIGFKAPTRNPQLQIDLPDDMECEYDFGPENKKVEPSHIVRRYTLQGTYFPTAHMRVRWWPKEVSGMEQIVQSTAAPYG